MRNPRDVQAEADEQVKGFNIKVTHRDPVTGEVTKSDPYTLRQPLGQSGARASYFERPPGSGNLFDPKGNPAGRWDASKPEGKRHMPDAEHVAYVLPPTEDQKIAQENAALKAELAAIKAQQEKSLGDIKGAKKKDQGA